MKVVLLLAFIIFIIHSNLSDPSSDLTGKIDQLVSLRQLRALQIQIRKNGQSIYYHGKGIKNERNQSIDSNTMYRIASCSKSFTSVAIMQLVQQGKLKLNDTLSKILGFEVKNPHYPDVDITIQMILSHQSSIVQQDDQYDAFIQLTYNAKDGYSVPALKQRLTPEGKYYNPNMFPANRKPGQYFHYTNLGYLISGTIVQIITQKRFDIYQQQNILDALSQGQVENATYNVATIKDFRNLGTIYRGNQGKWVPTLDNYNSTIPQRNLTGYIVGTNAGIFSPQAGVRASVRHLNNYMHMYLNKGVLKNGKRLISQQSVNQIQKPRYQYHGPSGGQNIDYHLYGAGIYTTSFSRSDITIEHETVKGHTGEDWGLISAYHFWKDYSFSYIISGALEGYLYDDSYIYELERMYIYRSVDTFIQNYQQKQENYSLAREKLLKKK